MTREVNNFLVAAHDLKAPLSLVRQLALSLDLVDDPSSSQRVKSQIISVSERALHQVNDLLKISRLEDGLFEMQPVSVRAICDDVYRELMPVFRLERRKLNMLYKNRSRLASASPELLHGVIYNFCTNALRYSSVDSESFLTVSDHRGKIRVSVRDFGPALPNKLWRELKKGAVKHPVEISMRPGSSGLGLYIISEFSAHLGAHLGAIRHRDGTSFYIDLPISTQATLF